MTREDKVLPKGWVLARIADTGQYINGFAFKPEHWEVAGKPIIRIQNLTNPTREFNRTTFNAPEPVRVEPGDILVSWSATLDAFIWNGEPALLNQHIFRVIPQEQLVTQSFLFYLLKEAIWEMTRTEHFHGSTMRHINRGPFMAFSVPIPPRNEQKRIVQEIEKQFTRLDAAVAALKRVQANLKRYRAAVLKAACEGRLVPTEAELARRERRSYEPASVLFEHILATPKARWEAMQVHKLKANGKSDSDGSWKTEYIPAPTLSDTPLARLPEGWQWATTGQVGNIQLGRQRSPRHHSGTHMRPYLRVANVFEDRIDASDILTMNFTPNEFRTFELKSGDILLNEGQSLELVGRAAIYDGEVPGACFQNTLIRFRPYPGVDAAFALLVFRSYLHNQRFQKIARWTTNIAHLGAGRLSAVEFPIPPIKEQLRIVAESARQLSIINELGRVVKANLKRADNLRQSILKRAFEGKLVPQDPSDDPASALLERIRAEREAKSVSVTSNKQAREASVR